MQMLWGNWLEDGADSDNDAVMDPVEDNDKSDSNPNTDTPKHLGEQILEFWNKWREKLIMLLSIAAWFCSPDKLIWKDVMENLAQEPRLMVESVIAKLYHPIWEEDLGENLQYYSRSHLWKNPKAVEAHHWHKMYSAPLTTVFGYVACCVTSKTLGCGGAERNWGTYKYLKHGKRSHMSAERSEQQATVYGAVCIEKCCTMRACCQNVVDRCWHRISKTVIWWLDFEWGRGDRKEAIVLFMDWRFGVGLDWGKKWG
jgi:hypothetical protein